MIEDSLGLRDMGTAPSLPETKGTQGQKEERYKPKLGGRPRNSPNVYKGIKISEVRDSVQRFAAPKKEQGYIQGLYNRFAKNLLRIKVCIIV